MIWWPTSRLPTRSLCPIDRRPRWSIHIQVRHTWLRASPDSHALSAEGACRLLWHFLRVCTKGHLFHDPSHTLSGLRIPESKPRDHPYRSQKALSAQVS